MPTAVEDQVAVLDEANRQQQAANASAVAMLVIMYYSRVDMGNLAGTGAPWLDEAIRAIVAGYGRSANMQLAYSRAVRTLKLPDAPPLPTVAIVPPNLEQIRESLTYTGLVTAAQNLAKTPKDVPADPGGITPRPLAFSGAPADAVITDVTRMAEQALAQAEATNRTLDKRRKKVMVSSAVKAAGASARLVQLGGRSAAIETVRRDPVAVGYVRVTRGGCCGFCAMLASRGPVYRSKDTFKESDARFVGFGEIKVHDSCQCSFRPVYNRSFSEWPDNNLTFSDLWYASTKGLSGKAAQNAFRHAWEHSEAYRAARAQQTALTR